MRGVNQQGGCRDRESCRPAEHERCKSARGKVLFVEFSACLRLRHRRGSNGGVTMLSFTHWLSQLGRCLYCFLENGHNWAVIGGVL
jgi:hypothetical protein